MPQYDSPGAIRREPGETFASFSGRQRASQLAAEDRAILKPKKRKARPSARQLADKRAADRIDGFDRDDIGESPDY